MRQRQHQDWSDRNQTNRFLIAMLLAGGVLLTPSLRSQPFAALACCTASALLDFLRTRHAAHLRTDPTASWSRGELTLAAASFCQATLWGVVIGLAMWRSGSGQDTAALMIAAVAYLAVLSDTHTPMPWVYGLSAGALVTPAALTALVAPQAWSGVVAMALVAGLYRQVTRHRHRRWHHRAEQQEHDRQRARELEQAQRAARRADRARARFLANVTHELRTPLNGIIGFSELSLDAAVPADVRENLALVRDSGEHMLTLINDLLDYSKIEHGSFELVNAPFEVRALLEDTVRQLSPLARHKDLAITCDIDPDLPPRLIGDDHRLRQILLNLGSNAIKFTDEGHVSIRARMQRRLGDRVILHLEVEDTGIGIPEDQSQVIFEAFRQADDASTRRHGGTGLGLAITSHLVRRMGGEVWVESRAGGGSRFQVTVTLALDSRPVTPADDIPGNSGSPLPRLRILVAEDNLVNQQLMVRLLESIGQDVELASDGRQAVTACGEQDYDLVLMDLQMPEMDGLEATRVLRSGPGGTSLRIVALTANAMAQDRAACLAAGMDGFLAKPVRRDQIASLIREVAAAEPV